MIGVVARQRANAEGAEELVLVEQLRQDAAELGLVQDGCQVTARNTGFAWIMNGRVEFGPSGQEPHEPVHDLGLLGKQLAFERGRRAERQQPDHGPHLEPPGFPAGQPEQQYGT